MLERCAGNSRSLFESGGFIEEIVISRKVHFPSVEEMLSRSTTVAITPTTAASVAAAAATAIHGNSTTPTPSSSAGSAPSPQLDKSEINDAVTKVLQGYDWTLVPIASK